MSKQSQEDEDGDKNKHKKPPPDGGWGWAIVFGCALSSVVNIPIIQNFGLIYRDRLLELDLSPTDITTIVSLNSAFGQIMGIFQGVLLKKFGFRKLAMIGVAFFTVGTFATGLSNSLPGFIFTHGMITSIGFTYSLTSFSMALYAYFVKRRSFASGVLLGISGIGSMLMPQLVTYLLYTYGVMATAFILAALNANGIAGALLLVPVEKSDKMLPKKKKSKIVSVSNTDSKMESNAEINETLRIKRRRNESESSTFTIEPSAEYYIHDRQLSFSRRYSESREKTKATFQSNGYLDKSSLQLNKDGEWAYVPVKEVDEMTNSIHFLEDTFIYGAHLASLETLGASRGDILLYSKSQPDFNEIEEHASLMARVETLGGSMADITLSGISLKVENGTVKGQYSSGTSIKKETEDKNPKSTFWSVLHELLDLDLLRDPIYVVITLGLSIAIIGELMFSIMTPFILDEIGFDLENTALFMSISAGTDIVARFTSPFLGKWIKADSKQMYIGGLCVLLIARTSLLLVSGYVSIILVAIFVGFGKGVRTVFWAQVLPDYVPIEKLGSAMSLQNLVNGILVIVAGPLTGKIAEVFNSYKYIVIVSNILTLMTVLLWTGTFIYRRFCKSK